MMLQTFSYRKLFSHLGFCYFFLLGITMLLQVVFMIPAMLFAPAWLETDWFLWVATDMPMYCVAVPLFFLLLHRMLPKSAPAPAAHRLTPAQLLSYLALGIGATYVLNFLSYLLISLISLLTQLPVTNPIEAMVSGSSILWTILFGCIVAPVGEEFIFRKALYHKLGALGDKCYILTGGFLFALFHGNLGQLFYAFALGMLFCYIFARTGCIWYTVFLHVAINLLGTVIAPLAMKNQTLLIIFGLCVMLCIAGGITFVALNFRKIQLSPPACELPAHPVRTALLSPGMLVFALMGLAIIVTTTLSAAFQVTK
ncbi:MAG: CPBP family intramembrane glutamic endopeptidase [Ruthenibacterium sp.]